MKPPRLNDGLTLLELLVTLTIAALLAAASTPSLSGWIDSKRLESAANGLKLSLQHAREMAVMTGVTTIICPTVAPSGEARLSESSATARCSDSSAWHLGWLIYQDTNGDQSQQATEPLLRRGQALKRVTAVSSVHRRQLRFYPNGTAPGQTATITLCNDQGTDKALGVVLANSGRISVRRAGESGFHPSCPS